MRSQGRSFHVCVGLAGQNEKADKAYTQVRFGFGTRLPFSRREYYVVVCCAPYHLHRIKFTQKTVPTSQLLYSLAQVLVPLFLSHTKTFLA
jgi:hypothetical protein